MSRQRLAGGLPAVSAAAATASVADFSALANAVRKCRNFCAVVISAPFFVTNGRPGTGPPGGGDPLTTPFGCAGGRVAAAAAAAVFAAAAAFFESP